MLTIPNRAFLISCVMLLALAGHAVAGKTPSLADRLAARLQEALPDYHFAVVDPLRVKAGPRGGKFLYQVTLDMDAARCEADPAGCDARLSDFAQEFLEKIERTMPLTAESLCIAVRPVEYLKKTEACCGKMVSAPLAEGLVALCFYDRPNTMAPATVASVLELGLTPKLAIQSCKDNLRNTVGPLSHHFKGAVGDGIGAMLGLDSYTSSYFALHEDWAPIAAKMDGRLIVAVPGDDVVLYAKEEDRRSVESMALYASELSREVGRPLSTKVFRWKKDGWEVASE